MNKINKYMKNVFLLILSISLIGFLCGCGEKPPIEKGKIKIRYVNVESFPELIKRHRAIVDRFNQTHPDIDVVYEVGHGGAQKILVEIAGGAAPDVFFWWEHLLGPVAEKGAIIDLSPYIKDVNLDEYFPLFANWQYNGKLYGFPFIWSPNAALFYNKDSFNKAGLEYPDKNWTWDDFLEAAKKLTIISDDGKVLQYGAGAIDNGFAITVLHSFGGDFFDEDTTMSTIDSPEAIEAFNYLIDLQSKYKVIPKTQELVSSQFGNKEMFEARRLAMYISSFNALEGFKKHIKDFSWDIAPIPMKKGKSRVVGGGSSALCISAQSKHPKEASEFIKFACGYEGGKILAEHGGIPTNRKALLEVLSPPPEHILEACVEQVEYFRTSQFYKKTWAQEFETRIMNPEFEKLFYELQTIDQTINNIKKESEKLIKGGK